MGIPANDDGEARKQAIIRFKKHLNELGGENEIAKYIRIELESMGYILKQIKKEGFRAEYIR